MSQIQKDILFLRITDALRENDFFHNILFFHILFLIVIFFMNII